MRYYITSIFFILLVYASYLLLDGCVLWLVWIGLSLFYIGLLVYGSIEIASQFYVRTVCLKKQANGCVAITFDDGPESENTPEILALLKQYEAKASFFVVGKQCEAYPEMLKKTADAGHLIGNHSYSHSYFFPLFSVSNIRKELTKTQEIIKHSIGEEPLFFRPPFGVTNPLIYRALFPFHFTVVGWSIRTFDTVRTKEQVLHKIQSKVQDGAVILLHSTTKDILWILKNTLELLEEKSLKVVRIDELINR